MCTMQEVNNFIIPKKSCAQCQENKPKPIHNSKFPFLDTRPCVTNFPVAMPSLGANFFSLAHYKPAAYESCLHVCTQPNTFSIPLNNIHVEPFPLPFY